MDFWIIVKPEALMFCREDLVDHLCRSGFKLIEKHSILRWDQLSLALYSDSNKLAPDQLALQNIGRKQLLGEAGDRAELWVLASAGPVKWEDGYKSLNHSKHEFRKAHWHSRLNVYFEYNGKYTIYHYSFYHVPNPEKAVIERELKIVERYLV